MARPEHEPKTPLAHRLREIRRCLGDEDRDVIAKRLGVSKSAIAMYERGDNVPTATILIAYRENFGVDTNWLLTGEGEMFSDPAKAPAPVLDHRLMRKLARIAIKVNKELNIKDTQESAAAHAAELYNELRVMVQNINDPEEVEAAMPLLTLTYKRKISAEFNDRSDQDERRA